MIKSERGPCLWDNPGPDGGWSWIILACNCLFLTLAFGLCGSGSTGILFIELVSVFGITRKESALPFSVIGIMQCITGLTYGLTSRWFSMRKIMVLSASLCTIGLCMCFWATDIVYVSLTFGMIYGCGYGIFLPTSLLFLNQYFKKFKATSNAIFMTAGPAAGLFLPYLVNTLVNEYGLRGAFLLLGGVLMQLLVAAFLMRPRTPEHFPCLASPNPLIDLKVNDPDEKSQPAEDNKTDASRSKAFLRILSVYKNVMTDPMFYVVTTQAVMAQSIFVCISLTFVDHAMDNNLSRKDGILLLTIFYVADVLGRILLGLLTDRGWISSAKLSLLLMIVQGLSLCLVGIKPSFAWFTVILMASGFTEGGLSSTCNVLYYHYIDRKNLPTALGLRTSSNGLMAVFRPLMAGFFRDSYRSYLPFYCLVGGLALWSAFLWSLEPCFVRFNRRRQEK